MRKFKRKNQQEVLDPASLSEYETDLSKLQTMLDVHSERLKGLIDLLAAGEIKYPQYKLETDVIAYDRMIVQNKINNHLTRIETIKGQIARRALNPSFEELH